LFDRNQQSFGDHGEGETPGSIPNPEAKPFSADGTALVKVWESRTSPDNYSKEPCIERCGALFCLRLILEDKKSYLLVKDLVIVGENQN
jgi:hypothetical protein